MIALSVFVAALGCTASTEPERPANEGACIPNCHWDCLGREKYICVNGELWAQAYGPRPCCRDEPWPGPGPMCSYGTKPVARCPAGCADYHSCAPTTTPSDASSDASGADTITDSDAD